MSRRQRARLTTAKEYLDDAFADEIADGHVVVML